MVIAGAERGPLWITRCQLEAAAAGAERLELLELEPLDFFSEELPDFSDEDDDLSDEDGLSDEELVDSELLDDPPPDELLAASRLSVR
jgi:hypothetical protein